MKKTNEENTKSDAHLGSKLTKWLGLRLELLGPTKANQREGKSKHLEEKRYPFEQNQRHPKIEVAKTSVAY